LKSIDDVLAYYLSPLAQKNPHKAELLQSYYKTENHKKDSVFTIFRNDEFQIEDYADVFSDSKTGNTLVYYSSVESLEIPIDCEKCKYPLWSFFDSAIMYYGMKLNILSHISSKKASRLLLYYGSGKKHEYAIKPIMAEVLLEHYRVNYLYPKSNQKDMFHELSYLL